MYSAPDLRIEREGALHYLVQAASTPSAAPRPVLCFLHGHDEGAPMDIEEALTRHGPLSPGAAAEVAQFIIVSPQLPTRGDIWERYADDVLRIVRALHDNGSGDVMRTYLTGFSFGGNGVFDLALAQRSFWAALWPVDPTRVPLSDPQRPVWLSFGAIARFAKNRFIRRLELQPAEENPADERLYLDEGEDHVGAARRAYADERIYAWLLSQQLKGSGSNFHD